MRLLVFTQKMDMTDTALSFFHGWTVELSKRFEQVTVVCLFEGKHELPKNVKVLSLGKENGRSRIKYLTRFYSFIWKLRGEYDAVFVHQNQEYAILGGPVWKLLRKPLYLWRNHYAGSFVTDIAAAFCTKVFCTSKFSYTAKFKKTVFMPVGVDTDFYKPVANVKRQPYSILSLGRIALSKKIHLLLEALAMIKKEGINFSASIYGDALPEDLSYLKSLEDMVGRSGMSADISFKRGVPSTETPYIYSAHDIFVNMSRSGMLDKTIFEAMACKTLALSSSKDLAEKLGSKYIFKEGDNVEDLASHLKMLLSFSLTEREAQGTELRKFVENNHSLHQLCLRLAEEIS